MLLGVHDLEYLQSVLIFACIARGGTLHRRVFDKSPVILHAIHVVGGAERYMHFSAAVTLELASQHSTCSSI